MPLCRFRTWIALAAAATVLAACGQVAPTEVLPGVAVSTRSPSPGPSAAAVSPPEPTSSAGDPPAAEQIQVERASSRLPVATSRAVALVLGGEVYICGGLTSSGATTGSILRLDPATGRVSAVGVLTAPVHDAGGAVLNGVGLVVGGGRFGPGAVIQRVGGVGASVLAGRLPLIRADLAAVAVDGEIIVVGGGTPARSDSAVLASSDGRTFRTIAQLKVAVRYPAVAAVGNLVYVIGGSTPSGDTSAIQTIDLATGLGRIVGHLPHALSHAAAFSVGGTLLVGGGRLAGRAQAALWQIDLATGKVKAVGHLPYAVSDAALAVVGRTSYLIGGEAAGPLASIITITVR